MDSPDGIAAIVGLALKHREPRGLGRANGNVDKMLSVGALALA
jgi:hypothetical protein